MNNRQFNSAVIQANTTINHHLPCSSSFKFIRDLCVNPQRSYRYVFIKIGKRIPKKCSNFIMI